MLVAQDHIRHPIIQREIKTLLNAGYVLSVLDQAGMRRSDPIHEYKRVMVPPVNLALLGRAVWIFLRRIPICSLGEVWWTFIYILQFFLTAVRYFCYGFKEKADVYVAQDLDSLLPALAIGKLRGRPVLYDAHELISEQGYPNSLRNRFLRRLEKRLVPHAAQLIVPNALRAQFFGERYRVRTEPVVILNCSPTAIIKRTDILRVTLGLPPSTRVVLYHGTLMPERALEELILSAHEFDPEIALVIIGEQDTFYNDVLRPLWERERLGDRVFFLPYVSPSEIMQYVASADLGVVIYENVNLNNYLCAPTKLYEYLMARVPIIACDFPELRMLLEKYPVGRTLASTDPASIAAAVNDFFKIEPHRRAEMDRQLLRARQRFNWESESQKLLDVFASLSHSTLLAELRSAP